MMRDYCNKEGATRLKVRIEQYWSQRGFRVRINLVPGGFLATMRSARTDLRSDMINGVPRYRQVEADHDLARR